MERELDLVTLGIHLGFGAHSIVTESGAEHFEWHKGPEDLELVQWIELGSRAMFWRERGHA